MGEPGFALRNGRGGSRRAQGEMLHEYNHGGDERQSRKREDASAPVFSQGLLRRLGGCASGGPALHHHPVHTDRLSDVLDRLCAVILVSEPEFVLYLRVHGIRDADAAGFGEALEARGDVDAVAVDLFAVDHHVAEVDADAELHPALGWQRSVLSLECGLDLDGALDRIHDARELGEYTITGGVDEPSVMLLHQRIDQLAMGGQSAKSRLLVLPHEAAIAEDIGAEYGGELTLHDLTPGGSLSSSLQSGLVQVGTDAFFISFILIRESLNKGVYREVGTHPQNLRCLRSCLWLTPQLNIVDG